METYFKAVVSPADWNAAIASEKDELIFEQLALPLHKGLNDEQSFDFLERLNVPQQLVLTYDYVRGQILQGGFIQLIQNKYVYLLMPLTEALQQLTIMPELMRALDDALKIFVLNHEALLRETDSRGFAMLYEEFKEFEGPDKVFTDTHEATVAAIVAYAKAHLDKLIAVDD